MPYAKIGSVTFIPYIATPGQTVAGTIILENPLFEGALAVSVDVYRQAGEYLFSPYVAPSESFVYQTSTALFATQFTMPNYNIEVWVFSWAWLEKEDEFGNPLGEWDWYQHEKVGPILIKLSSVPSEPPALTDLNIRYEKSIATLSLPSATMTGNTVKGALRIDNSSGYDANLIWGGRWESLLLGAAGGWGNPQFTPSSGIIKQGEVLVSEVSFIMPNYSVKVWAIMYRYYPSTGVYEFFEQEGPLVVTRL